MLSLMGSSAETTGPPGRQRWSTGSNNHWQQTTSCGSDPFSISHSLPDTPPIPFPALAVHVCSEGYSHPLFHDGLFNSITRPPESFLQTSTLPIQQDHFFSGVISSPPLATSFSYAQECSPTDLSFTKDPSTAVLLDESYISSKLRDTQINSPLCSAPGSFDDSRRFGFFQPQEPISSSHLLNGNEQRPHCGHNNTQLGLKPSTSTWSPLIASDSDATLFNNTSMGMISPFPISGNNLPFPSDYSFSSSVEQDLLFTGSFTNSQAPNHPVSLMLNRRLLLTVFRFCQTVWMELVLPLTSRMTASLLVKILIRLLSPIIHGSRMSEVFRSCRRLFLMMGQ
jgi:hypothetical protein